MKKKISILAVILLVLGLTACGNTETPTVNENTETYTVDSTTEETGSGKTEEPRIMDTFVESYNFDGITMIPFCTSGSSGIGSSGRNLADNAGSGKWLDGQRFGAGASEDEIRSWIEGLQ